MKLCTFIIVIHLTKDIDQPFKFDRSSVYTIKYLLTKLLCFGKILLKLHMQNLHVDNLCLLCTETRKEFLRNKLLQFSKVSNASIFGNTQIMGKITELISGNMRLLVS